ncbi:PilW family protein [Jeongeupia chitinilytica]|uniref:Prepilin-type N-terminal cleavage/methylation domain-containing protein n=1 Tax=Jeongeupia chitinilytica TaxID=1041641 RepID=A0ABQ3H134_9NEIS|nr:prepilin-type N-terminal cleavage/methylation domain-containing protein [Jeongeupia chitinilytica]GHD63486.1 hypothetical protein GCM10007350_20900 [Jeongeupia chitinilytica]
MLIRQKGFSILEIMVALAIGMVLLLGVTTYLLTNLRTSRDVLSQARLNQDMRTIMDLMTRDIRRAGYYGSSSDTANFSQLFRSTTSNPVYSASDLDSNGACIVYRYDRDSNGALGADETFGFWYSGSGRTLYLRQSSATGTTCSGSTGVSGSVNWLALNDSTQIEITRIQFCYVDPAAPDDIPPTTCNAFPTGVATQAIAMILQARLTGKPDSTLTLQQRIQLRNQPTAS